MSLLEPTLLDLAIKDPKNYLNKYCEEISKLPGMEITKVCKTVKDEVGNKIPAHCFTDFVDDKFKNQSQLKKGKERHKEELTKEKKARRIANWIRKQPKDFVDSFYEEMVATAEPEIEMEKYVNKK